MLLKRMEGLEVAADRDSWKVAERAYSLRRKYTLLFHASILREGGVLELLPPKQKLGSTAKKKSMHPTAKN